MLGRGLPRRVTERTEQRTISQFLQTTEMIPNQLIVLPWALREGIPINHPRLYWYYNDTRTTSVLHLHSLRLGNLQNFMKYEIFSFFTDPTSEAELYLSKIATFSSFLLRVILKCNIKLNMIYAILLISCTNIYYKYAAIKQ